MRKLSDKRIKQFKQAFLKDYGIELTDNDAYLAATGLIDFMSNMIKFMNDYKKEVLKSSKPTP